MEPDYTPTRSEATLHITGFVLLVGAVVLFLLAPRAPTAWLVFLVGTACLGAVHWRALQRQTDGRWLHDLQLAGLRRELRVWRQMCSLAAIRRSALIAISR